MARPAVAVMARLCAAGRSGPPPRARSAETPSGIGWAIGRRTRQHDAYGGDDSA